MALANAQSALSGQRLLGSGCLFERSANQRVLRFRLADLQENRGPVPIRSLCIDGVSNETPFKGRSRFLPCKQRSFALGAQAAEQSHSEAADRRREENRAHLAAHREETHDIEELDRPLAEYMSLPASQYSVLDAQRIERVDDKTFKCYVHRIKFFAFEVCPVLLVRVDEKPNGCSIRLLSCTLEGSPLVVAQNQKFSASMVNNVQWSDIPDEPTRKRLISDTTIDVSIEVPPPFRRIPVEGIEVTGHKVLQQLLRLVLPRFLSQLEKDYKAWASGDESRKPLGTGEL